MMKYLSLFLFIALFCPFHSTGQSTYFFDIDNCSNAGKVTVTQSNPQITTLYTQHSNYSCGNFNIFVGGVSIAKFKYELQKKNGSSYTTVSTVQKDANNHTFTGLDLNGIYRVKVTERRGAGNVYPSPLSGLNPCFQSPKGLSHSETINAYTNEIEIAPSATPVPIASIIELSGENLNDKICFEDVEDIILDARNTLGETEYGVDITLLGGSGAWAGTGMIVGQAGLINLYEEIWEPKGWTFWHGYTYRVQLAVRNACDRWEATTIEFEVLPTGGDCRLAFGEETASSITLYPNPATDELRLKGLAEVEEPIDYTIYNIAGKILRRGRLVNQQGSIDVADFNNGSYIVQFVIEDEVVSKKFNVFK